MSKIKEQMMQDLKEAMKSGDTCKRDTLRLLNAALKQVEVDERIVLDDERVLQILRSAYKQREDALQAYVSGDREDLAEKEKMEMELISSYLPKQLNDEELEQKLKQIIMEIKAEGLKDLGRVMAESRAFAALASGKRISEMAKKLLGAEK